MPYRRIRARGLIFHFKYDDEHPEFLHIYVRHLTSIQDVLATFFDPSSQSVWNEQRKRWETTSQTHTLYWTWLEEHKRVLVMTCFRL